MCFSFPQTPEKLTATEQTIVEYIAGHRDEFLCMTISQLSAALNISEATISRFSRHVGCNDFKHLKRVIVEQTVQKGPAQKLANALQSGNGDFLHDWMTEQQYNLQKTLELMDQDQFSKAVETLQGAHRVFLYAKNASRAPAQLLEFRLRRIGINVYRISSGGSELLESLAHISSDDLVVLFGFLKLSTEGRIILDYQQQAGYKVILFTSRTYHEEDQHKMIRLFVYRGEENEYHSMSAPIAVVDALILALSARMGTEAVDRLESIRRLKTEYRKRL